MLASFKLLAHEEIGVLFPMLVIRFALKTTSYIIN